MEEKKCKLCGSMFRPKNNNQKCCRELKHTRCQVCGRSIDYICGNYIPLTCSVECRQAYSKINMLNKYGVDNPAKLQSSKNKAKQTCLDKYGHEYYTQTTEYKQRVQATCLSKYGTNHHLKANEVIDKRTNTVREKYGTDNVFQNSDIKKKSRETLQAKYGVDNVSQSPYIQSKIRQSNIDKFGVEHPMMLKEYKNKAIKTNEERYGRKAFTQQHIEDIDKWYSFIKNPKEFIANNYSQNPRSIELANDLGVDTSTVDLYLNRFDAYDSISSIKSIMEYEVVNYLRELRPDIVIVSNSRSVIGGYEIDIYLPEYHIGIECNPTCTHNSSIADPWGGPPKSYNYHKIKSDRCESKGIFLFHIFGYQWTNRKDVVKSMLANLIQANSTKIYARQCNVEEVTAVESSRFLELNHLQGSTNASIRLGLYYNHELVSLMTFGKMRSTIGRDHSDLSNCWELSRFCSKLGYSVTGGASKLFKYFITSNNPVQIRSFSDRAHTQGNLYNLLGFTKIRQSEANYVWVDVKSDIGYHRINAQKRNIKKFLSDDTIDLNKTEKQIMIEHGYVQVFDSGTVTWEWEKQK